MAVLILSGASAMRVPGWLLASGIVIVAMLGAFAQWIASASGRRQKCVRLVMTFLGGSALILIADTCWVPDWLCLMF